MILFLLIALTPMDETLPDGSFSYPGQNRREVILFDPDNSPHFDAAYQRLTSQITPEMEEVEILQTVGELIETLFDREKGSPQSIYSFAGTREVPLDAFLEEKIGICRHYALVAALFLKRLSNEGWIDGEARLIRRDIPDRRHGWCLFLSEDHAWHFDPLWGILEDMRTETGTLRLYQRYGKKAIDRVREQHAH